MNTASDLTARSLAAYLRSGVWKVRDDLVGIEGILDQHLIACKPELLKVVLAMDELEASLADLYEAVNEKRKAERKEREGV